MNVNWVEITAILLLFVIIHWEVLLVGVYLDMKEMEFYVKVCSNL